MKKAILIGDSIRMGYEPVVKTLLSGMADIWAPEENCGHTRTTLANLDEWVMSRNPDIVHINCGLHDMAREPGDPPGNFIYCPVDEYRENVRAILKRLLSRSAATILWALTTPVSLERQHAYNYPVNRTSADVANYNIAASAVAQAMNVRVNDLHRIVTEAGVERLLAEDGVHYTVEGCEVLGKAVATAIRGVLVGWGKY